MTIITLDRRVILPTGAFRYHGPIGHDRHHLISEANGEAIVLSDKELVDIYGRYGLKLGSRRNSNKYDEAGGLGPDEVLKPMEMARAWFCRAFDKAPTSLSTRALDAFVRRNADAAKKEGVTHLPSAGALRRAINARGEPGRRPSKAMRTLRGTVRRATHFPAFVEKVLERTVAWHWSVRGRKKGEAYARVVCLIKIANRFGPALFGGAWRPLPTPSKETVRFRINRAECRATWAAKFSDREAALRFEGSGEGLTASRILEKVVIDSTVADGWCVWRGETMMPLGRPTLYIAVDVYSRQVVNWFLTYEPPSLYGVMGLLKRIVTPNEEGVWGKPGEIIVDNTWEHVSPSFQDACDSAGINVRWAPIKTPEYKAIVERAFGTLNTMLFKKLLGGSVKFPAYIMSRLGLDPSKTANLTLERLEELLTQTIREVYAHRIHDGTKRPPQLLWERGLERGRHVIDDLPDLVANFGQVETCTLTRSGVKTRDGLRFFERDVVTRLLNALARDTAHRERRKGSATARVKVVVNPEDFSQCMVWDSRNRRPEYLHNVHSEFAKACSSRWEYRQLKAFADAENQAFESDEDRLKQLNSLREQIEAMAPELKAAALKRRRKLLAQMSNDAPSGAMILRAQAPASADGRNPVDADVPTLFAARVRKDDRLPKGVRRGGKKATEKQQRTMAARRQARSDSADIDRKETTTGLPITEPIPKAEPTSLRDPRRVRALAWVLGDKGAV
jgi:putative transposase